MTSCHYTSRPHSAAVCSQAYPLSARHAESVILLFLGHLLAAVVCLETILPLIVDPPSPSTVHVCICKGI